MKSIHLVIADLFLPKEFASGVYADLHLPALEKILARWVDSRVGNLPTVSTQIVSGGQIAHPTQIAPLSLEAMLCEMFGVPCQGDVPIAPVSAAFDGLGEGCWLRADPVHLRLQRERLILLPNVEVSANEAAQLCASLNEYFAGQDMEFFAPHPQRWYVRVDRLPDIETVLLSQAAGHNVHGLLPKGVEATRWHQVFNEIQMLLFAHPVNEAREARGELPINSVWLWGEGVTGMLPPTQKNYDFVSSDEVLVEMFAAAAGIPFAGWAGQWNGSLTPALMERLAIRLGCPDAAAKSLVISRGERGFSSAGRQLLVWTGLRSALQRGDLPAWRAALQDFEIGYAQPLWQALRAGKIAQLQIDILGGDNTRRVLLTRGDTWAFWWRTKRLAGYSMV